METNLQTRKVRTTKSRNPAGEEIYVPAVRGTSAMNVF
jgi:hypothetical protein